MVRESRQPLVERRSHEHVDVLTVGVAELYQADTVEELAREIREAIDASDASTFVLDLSVVRFMTSAALGLLINIRSHLVDRGYTFALAGVAGEVADVLEHTGLDKLIPVYPTAEEAVDHFRRP